ncbi:MAG: glycoside hydrolase family 25 protein [Muribaculaceae bacterium]|nr:glycoside hydrolase family 25 protein [Muribaculaceae bacterium]
MAIPNENNRLLLLVVLAVLLLLPSCGGSGEVTGQRRHIAPRDSTAPYDGIDISSHQGDIDWTKVASDKYIRFVYIKATEGATYRSSHYRRNVEGAHRHGLLVGSYHYVTSTSAIDAQARNFIMQAPRHTQDLIPMLDVEERGSWSRSQLIDSVARFAQLLEKHYGRKPMIYSTIDFYNKNLAPHFNKYPLYIGRYSSQAPSINWQGSYTVWQFTENGIIPGIDAYVDLCHYHDDGWLDEIAL